MAGQNGNLSHWARVRKPDCSRCARNSVFTLTSDQHDCGRRSQNISPLRPERLAGSDFEIVRELAGDIYFGEHSQQGEKKQAIARDVAEYSVPEIERVARYAFERAASRKKHLTSVDKANVLATSTLWRQTVAAL